MRDFKFYHGIGKVVAMLATIHRDPEKHPEGFSEIDFMPPYLVPPSLRKRKPGKPDRVTGNVGDTKLQEVNQRDFLFNVFKCGVGKKGKVVKKPQRKRIVKRA